MFKFLSNPGSPSSYTVGTADGLPCILSLEVSKHQLTMFTFICRLLSTPYEVVMVAWQGQGSARTRFCV